MKTQLEEMLITSITVDPDLRCNATTDESIIQSYVDMVASIDEWPFPPIHCVGGLLVDGAHRLEAAKRLNKTTILAFNMEGTHADAEQSAFAANIARGGERPSESTRTAVRNAILANPDGSDRHISQSLGASRRTVASIRRDLEGHWGGDPAEKFAHRMAAADKAKLEELSSELGMPGQVIDGDCSCYALKHLITAKLNTVLADACCSLLMLETQMLSEGIHEEEELELINRIVSLQRLLGDNHVPCNGVLVFAE